MDKFLLLVVIVVGVCCVFLALAPFSWVEDTRVANEYCKSIGYDSWEGSIEYIDNACIRAQDGELDVQPIFIDRKKGFDVFWHIFSIQTSVVKIYKLNEVSENGNQHTH